MATPTTTWRLITNQQVTKIRGLTPSSLSTKRFALLQTDKPFDDYVQANPTANLRRFEIIDSSVLESPLVWDLVTRQVEGAAQIRIAYPKTWGTYGRNGIRDANELINEDMIQISTALETPSNYVSGQQSCRVTASVADLGPVLVAEIDASFIYHSAS